MLILVKHQHINFDTRSVLSISVKALTLTRISEFSYLQNYILRVKMRLEKLLKYILTLTLLYSTVQSHPSMYTRRYHKIPLRPHRGSHFHTPTHFGTNSNSLLKSLDESLAHCGPHKIDIRELTILQAQKYFKTGALSSLELTLCYLQRIAEMDIHLKSVIEVNPEAIRIAMQADKDRISRKKTNQSPLHGIPVLIKDNIGTADFMETTAGAVAMKRLKPWRDADVVKRLRLAGAVILGKTNPSEWAYFRGTDIPSGWSGRGGQTWSPYNLTNDPSGSSSGSGAAISANLAVIALGTETDGSILSPSSRGSLIGLKPTLGAVATRGVIPLAFSQDVVGPMSRSAVDAAILMDILSDIKLEGCGLRLEDCLENQNFRIGILRYPYWNATDPSLATVIPHLKKRLETLGRLENVAIIDPVVGRQEDLEKVTGNAELIVFRHEFKYSINKYLKEDVKHLEASLGRNINSLEDIVKFNIENPPPEGYNQVQLIASEATDGLQNATYIKAREGNRELSKNFIEKILDIYKLSAIATPCFSVNTQVFYSYAAFAGFPSVTVPVGVDEEAMPFGICLTGRPNSEAVLLKLAYLLERSVGNGPSTGRAIPTFKS